MAITIDKASMVFLPTSDPNIMEVSLDYTKDDLAAVSEWTASWKSISLLWNKNTPAADFLPAVQAAIAAQREERTEQKTVKTAIIAATSQCKAITRTDPNASPSVELGSDADHPVFVKVVT